MSKQQKDQRFWLLGAIAAVVVVLFGCFYIIQKIIKKEPKGTIVVVLARIPNTIGMLIENAVISISLASYSFIQPMILVSLFVIALIRREQYSKLNLIGGVICVCGVILFQIAGNILQSCNIKIRSSIEELLYIYYYNLHCHDATRSQRVCRFRHIRIFNKNFQKTYNFL